MSQQYTSPNHRNGGSPAKTPQSGLTRYQKEARAYQRALSIRLKRGSRRYTQSRQHRDSPPPPELDGADEHDLSIAVERNAALLQNHHGSDTSSDYDDVGDNDDDDDDDDFIASEDDDDEASDESSGSSDRGSNNQDLKEYKQIVSPPRPAAGPVMSAAELNMRQYNAEDGERGIALYCDACEEWHHRDNFSAMMKQQTPRSCLRSRTRAPRLRLKMWDPTPARVPATHRRQPNFDVDDDDDDMDEDEVNKAQREYEALCQPSQHTTKPKIVSDDEDVDEDVIVIPSSHDSEEEADLDVEPVSKKRHTASSSTTKRTPKKPIQPASPSTSDSSHDDDDDDDDDADNDDDDLNSPSSQHAIITWLGEPCTTHIKPIPSTSSHNTKRPKRGVIFYNSVSMDRDDNIFHCGDCVELHAEDVKSDNYVARIVALYRNPRKPDHEQDWCEVQWFYRQADLPSECKITSRLVKNELILSNHYDVFDLSKLARRVVVTFSYESINPKELAGMKKHEYSCCRYLVMETNKVQFLSEQMVDDLIGGGGGHSDRRGVVVVSDEDDGDGERMPATTSNNVQQNNVTGEDSDDSEEIVVLPSKKSRVKVKEKARGKKHVAKHSESSQESNNDDGDSDDGNMLEQVPPVRKKRHKRVMKKHSDDDDGSLESNEVEQDKPVQGKKKPRVVTVIVKPSKNASKIRIKVDSDDDESEDEFAFKPSPSKSKASIPTTKKQKRAAPEIVVISSSSSSSEEEKVTSKKRKGTVANKRRKVSSKSVKSKKKKTWMDDDDESSSDD